MAQKSLSRRTFLGSVGGVVRSSAIVLTMPMLLAACNRAEQARLGGEKFQTLAEEEAEELEAIAARIIPTILWQGKHACYCQVANGVEEYSTLYFNKSLILLCFF